LVHIETTAPLEAFRRFLINSTCLTFIPEGYFEDSDIFPEKEGEAGSIYIEAADKVTLQKIRMITFINARDILGIIYTSKSGNTKIKWRQTHGKYGKVTGEASANSLVNLLASRVISREYADELANIKRNGYAREAREEEAWISDEGEEESSISEIPGLEGTLQTADDV
jgi:hypothetical protein